MCPSASSCLRSATIASGDFPSAALGGAVNYPAEPSLNPTGTTFSARVLCPASATLTIIVTDDLIQSNGNCFMHTSVTQATVTSVTCTGASQLIEESYPGSPYDWSCMQFSLDVVGALAVDDIQVGACDGSPEPGVVQYV